MDTLVYCRFYRDMVQWPYITAVVNAAIGTDYTEEDLHRIANRIITMTHDFNAARGIGRETEKLPEWVTDKPMEDEEAPERSRRKRWSPCSPTTTRSAAGGSCRRSSSESSGATRTGPGLSREGPGPVRVQSAWRLSAGARGSSDASRCSPCSPDSHPVSR